MIYNAFTDSISNNGDERKFQLITTSGCYFNEFLSSLHNSDVRASIMEMK